MFTSSSPEDRRIGTELYQAAKADPSGARAPLKVVYVVLESQYQRSMSAAVKAINENENSGVACECVVDLRPGARRTSERGRRSRARPARCRPHLPVDARGHAPQQGRRVYHGLLGPVEERGQ